MASIYGGTVRLTSIPVPPPPLAERRDQLPASDDWERLKDIIEELYVEENKTLKEVMHIMAQKYGHFGT
jgi:hypothetical protein